MDLRDVGVIQGCKHLRFAAEAREAFRIIRDGRQEDLDRDLATELRVDAKRAGEPGSLMGSRQVSSEMAQTSAGLSDGQARFILCRWRATAMR